MPLLSEFAAHLPFLLTVSPLFGAGMVWLNGRRGEFAARQAAVTNATLTLGLALWMLAGFTPSSSEQPNASPVQMTTRISWGQFPLSLTASADSSPMVQMSLAFGVDGLSLWPLAALALIGWVTVLTADRCCRPWTEHSYVELLLGQSLALALFAVQDFLLFLAVCEAWTWWTFFAIGRQGGAERRAAAQRGLVQSSAVNFAWGLAGTGCAVCYAWIQAEVQGGIGGVTFLYPEMISRLSRWVTGHEMALYAWSTFQPWVLLLWLAGLCGRWPVFPLHAAWRTLCQEGRAPLVALCAAAGTLQGGYVLLRFVVPLFPPQGTAWAMILAAWASLGAWYFGMLTLSQTDWRKFLSVLTLFALHAAIIGALSGSIEGSLSAWLTLVITSLVVAAGWLLIGRGELEAMPTDFAGLRGLAWESPRWFVLMALVAGLLSAAPVFALINGQAMVEFMELRRLGIPNASLLFGGLLAALALVRLLLQIGFGRTAETDGDEPRTIVISPEIISDLQSRELLIGVLVAAAISLGLLPGNWRPLLVPTFERLHDPFAGQESTGAALQNAVMRPGSITVKTQKPNNLPGDAVESRLGRLSAPQVWMIFGFLLLIAPRLLGRMTWSSAASVVGLVAGLAVECIAALQRNSGFDASSVWTASLMWSLGIIGLVVVSMCRPAASSAQLGGWLLRLSAIGWAAVTQDLLLAGLAWELAEFSRMLAVPDDAGETMQTRRERMRHILSSACFWLGIALCLVVTGTTDGEQIAAQLARSIPRDDDGLITGSGPQLGLAAVVLLISAIGMRCGLAPWSLGRRAEVQFGCGSVAWWDQWCGALLGLTMLLHFGQTFQLAYSNMLTVTLTIAAAATVISAALSTVGESRVLPLIRGLLAVQLGGMVLLVAATCHEVQFPNSRLGELPNRDLLVQILACGNLSITVALSGLTAVLRRLGEPAHGDLFFEHYRGLCSKRTVEATLLIGALLSMIGVWPFGGFWLRWLGSLGLVMTPQRLSEDLIRPHAVLLWGGVLLLGTWVFPVSAAARWLRQMAFDPAVSSWEESSHRWDLLIAAVAILVSLAAGLSPAVFSAVILWGR